MTSSRFLRSLCLALSVCAAGVVLAGPPAASPAASPVAVRAPVAVVTGGDADLDACPTWAQVTGLDPNGDGFLTVRAGPGVDHAELDRLAEGRGLFVCVGTGDGRWLGVVYPRPGQDQAACDVSSPRAVAAPYRGDCASGWVAARWVKPVAG
jgi:hypothetical protein